MCKEILGCWKLAKRTKIVLKLNNQTSNSKLPTATHVLSEYYHEHAIATMKGFNQKNTCIKWLFQSFTWQ